jgi:sec-independent protein translocase protein TatB
MFDIAWSELLLIAVIALIFIGPKELPQVLHALGRMVAKLRRSADDFRRQFEDSVREAGYEDLHKNIQEFRSLHPANQLKDSIARAINQEYAPKPVTPAPQVPAQRPPTIDNHALQGEAELNKTLTETAASQQASAEAIGVAPVEKPAVEAVVQSAHSSGVSEPQSPASEPAKDRIAPAA